MLLPTTRRATTCHPAPPLSPRTYGQPNSGNTIEPLLHALPEGLVHNPESRNLGLDALAFVARASDAFSGIGIASVGLLVPQQATHVEVISQDTRPPRRMPPDRRIAPMFAVRSLDVLAIEVP